MTHIARAILDLGVVIHSDAQVVRNMVLGVGASQLLVFAIALTPTEHFQPDLRVARPNWTLPAVTSSTLPLGELRVHSVMR